MICTLFLNKYAHISMRSQKPEKKRRCANGSIEPTALALSISRDLLKNKRVINILPNLQAYFNNRRYFPILMSCPPLIATSALSKQCMKIWSVTNPKIWTKAKIMKKNISKSL